MKTIDIEIELMRYFDFRQNLIVNNVTNISGLINFETDLLILSKSNFATGVEIKITKADLKNDLKKRHIKQFTDPNKYKFYFNKLKHFYYAVPIDLLKETQKQIPQEFGIITCKKGRNRSCVAELVRKPKLLYNTKWTESQRMQLARLGATRIFSSKKLIRKLQKK